MGSQGGRQGVGWAPDLVGGLPIGPTRSRHLLRVVSYDAALRARSTAVAHIDRRSSGIVDRSNPLRKRIETRAAVERDRAVLSGPDRGFAQDEPIAWNRVRAERRRSGGAGRVGGH